MRDRILIRDLQANCIVGTNPRERVTRQNVVINIALECSHAQAARTDRLEDTIDYVNLRNRVLALVEESRFYLIERLADRICALCLDDPRVAAATVSVDKPEALTGARSVAVEVHRVRTRGKASDATTKA